MELVEITEELTSDQCSVSSKAIYPIPVMRLISPVPAPEAVVFGLTPAHASPWSVSLGKRFLDVFAALIALIILSPLILCVALVVSLTSAGPVLFTQKRVGKYGKLFTIYKFRSMRVRSAQHWSSHTKHGDPRLTSVGGWLRKFKLDELPQLLNVVLGDMSLVGPRPKLPGHESIYMEYCPGITSAATLAFRCEERMLQGIPLHKLESFYSANIKPVKHELDTEYMAKATIFSDLLLLVRTVIACLLPRTLEAASAKSDQYGPLLNESSD